MARGDRIYVYRDLHDFQGVYQHHGIDCGDGTVIHYRKPSETIERTSLATFARGNPIYRIENASEFHFIPDVVVERAESRLGEQKYNLLFNNCEHFATWCKTGISDSKQIREIFPAIAKIDISSLYEPLKQSFQGADIDKNNARQLLQKALADIKSIWERIQPEYKQLLQEVEIWQKVAEEAIRRNRDDLARAALRKKLDYKQRAQKLEEQLKQLADMTENLLRNSQNL